MDSRIWRSGLLVLVFLTANQAATAATFNVTKTADTADGACNVDCSLREAVIAANENLGRDTINIPAGTYRMSIPGAGEEEALTGDFDVTDDADIFGAGSDQTIIDGNFVDRVIDVFDDTFSGPSVRIEGMTITGGTCVCGGGIYADGNLTLVEVKVTNSVSDSGAGLCNANNATLIDVTFENNAADFWGGAIDNAFANMTLIRTTFINNTAGDDGGAICNQEGSMLVENSTFVGNSAPNGGVVWNSGSAAFDSSTMSGNAPGGAQVAFFQADGGLLDFRSSILANGPGRNCNVATGVTSSGYNLASDSSCGLNATGDQQNTNPQLGPLADNGGLTQTLLPLPGSPAIDTGSNAICAADDQRGQARPIDGDGDGQARCDIGAVEVEAPLEPIGTPITSFALADLAGGPDEEVVVVGDLNGNGRAAVQDLGTASAVGSVAFTDGLTPIDAQGIADLNNNNADDLALLVRQTQDIVPKVEVRDPLTGKRLKNVDFNKQHEPVALAILADQNGNQSEEAAVLAKRASDNRPRVLIRDIQTKAKVINISLPKIFDVLELVDAPDFSGNGKAEVLVLASRLSDSKAFVLVWDTGGTGKIVNVQLPKNHTPVDLAYLTGPGGVAAVAVLAVRTTDERGRVLVYDALTAVKLWAAILGAGQAPVAIRSFATSGGATRVAALVERTSDSKPIVRIFNGNTGAVVDNVSYDAGQAPVDLLVLADSTLDGNANPELGVLVNPDSDTQMRVRDSVTKNLLQTLSVP
jgi:CSLREA domain-containing protein